MIDNKNHLLLKKQKLVHKKNRKNIFNQKQISSKFLFNRIHVAKIAPEQPLPEPSHSPALRFDSTGHLLPYSILGTVNEYAAELSDIEVAEISSITKDNKKDTEDVPEIGTYNKKLKRPSGSPDGGARSLHNWKFRMDERRQVMKNMSSKRENSFRKK